MRKDRVGRVMTVDLALEGQRTLRLGSAYFPTTGTSSDERQAFYDEMTRYSADGEPRANTADVEPPERRVLLGSLRRLLDREGRLMTVDLALECQWTLRLG